MTKSNKSDIIAGEKMIEKEEAKVNPIREGYYYCCGNKCAKIDNDTTIIDGYIFCKKCKQSHKVVIVKGKLIRET